MIEMGYLLSIYLPTYMDRIRTWISRTVNHDKSPMLEEEKEDGRTVDKFFLQAAMMARGPPTTVLDNFS